MFSGTVTSRSNGTSRSSIDTSVLASGSIRSTTKSALQRDLAARRASRRGARRDRLGERALERGDVVDLDLVAHPPLREERVGEEGELQRRNRALDRHLGHVDDEPAAVASRAARRAARSRRRGCRSRARSAATRPRPCPGSGPAAARCRSRRPGSRTRGSDRRRGAPRSRRRRPARSRPRPGPHRREEAPARLDQLVRRVDAERQQQQTRLVEMGVVLVDDRDRPVARGQPPAQLVDRHRARGASSEDHQSPHDRSPRRSVLIVRTHRPSAATECDRGGGPLPHGV